MKIVKEGKIIDNWSQYYSCDCGASLLVGADDLMFNSGQLWRDNDGLSTQLTFNCDHCGTKQSLITPQFISQYVYDKSIASKAESHL